jgi:phage baseplate assembly protein gpV
VKQLLAMQRQIKDLEQQIQNMVRKGKIFDTKFDKEKKRWYVRLREGEEGSKEVFETDWLPWKTFANGAIKIHIPPKKGQMGMMTSLNGMPELGHVEGYHNDPDNPSPHGEEDQVMIRVEKEAKGKTGEDKAQTLDLLFTKDGSTVKIGDTTHALTKDAASTKTKKNSVDTETDTTKASKSHTVETQDQVTRAAKSHTLETGTRTVTATLSKIRSATYDLGGKVLINC